ncbi:hypothetical protein O181_117602 [Austropuccinia psidii MF-1]|uniref:Uncharacterized protein n=1 Tax=Austropuccinia psidii MF-1 TaxID=1389203 RepID=A0A9Q3KBJ6_9BASI|nr:hypothetical protein [Austropuccinia psidii MF-1]
MRILLPHNLHAYAPAPTPDETPTLPPSPPSPLLMLLHPCLIFSLASNPYAPVGPSNYTSDATLTPITLSAAYHPYACGVPSRHASDTTYHPYARGVPS